MKKMNTCWTKKKNKKKNKEYVPGCVYVFNEVIRPIAEDILNSCKLPSREEIEHMNEDEIKALLNEIHEKHGEQ